MEKKVIGVLVGSARRESYNKKIALEICKYLQPEFEIAIPDLALLPLFNQDYDDDGNTPPTWQAFRAAVAAMDAFLFVTPEYNRSVTPLMKNALDIASRPPGQNCWQGKPGGIVSVSPSAMGGFGSNQHLRQSMSFLNVFMLQQPEAYIGNVGSLFDEGGKLVERTRDFLQKYAEAFSAWVKRF